VPKLKGLLDTARTKLTGLLGDFPQGFNAGAVAGFPGWAGDMAYMADTARLALTGADQQAAPENYVGTTDYIAKQAGYPVPQTLSGQLGAAVGGLMSPGPGDLAKFAPVLSAIPFFHGSPHKYDAVDLSKIGTGEGAQAYGHGYYGADAQNTAEAYAANVKDDKTITDLNAELSRLAKIMNDDEAGGYRKYRSNAGREAAAQYDALMARRESVVSDPGNLYRGEYRWPDPAKEAATPLTGEDLLDWDRPLSEQPKPVQKALRDSGISGKKIQVAVIGDGPDGYKNDRYVFDNAFEARQLEKQMRESGYYVKPYVGPGDETGASFYKGLTHTSGGDAAASAQLQSLGIPGIRYLDQMSRGAGEGTRNYVMFDDKGIKLLERNGEPLKAAEDFAARRAGKAKPYKEAMGIDTIPAMPKQEPPKTAPDYGMEHRPPMRDSGAPLFDATGGGNVYPDDVYSAKAQQYYGTGDAKLDRETFRLLQSYRNEPDAPVTIYRAVPANVDATDINAGDWVTVNKAYADMHGQGFDGGYKIIKKQVKAKDIYTNGDSIHEWGYDPN